MDPSIINQISSYLSIEDLPKFARSSSACFNGVGGFHGLYRRLLKDLDFSVKIHYTSSNLRNAWVECYTQKLTLKERQDIRLDDLVHFLENSRQLIELNVEGCAWVNDSVIEALPKRVVSLNIGRTSGISNSAVNKLLVEHHGKLEELVLNAAYLEDKDLEGIAKCSKLKKLCVFSCENLTDKFIGYIQSLQSLICLTLRDGTNFTNKGYRSLFVCGSSNKFEEVDFSGCTVFEEESIKEMEKCAVKNRIESHSQKEELVIDEAKMEDEDLKGIARCSKLKKLFVYSCEELTDKFLGYIQSLKSLTHLTMMGGVKFTKEGFVSLIECGSLKHLEELDITDSNGFDSECYKRLKDLKESTGGRLERIYGFPK